VAADDGVMPQTREHLAILQLLGVRRGLVVITKADLADDERLLAVEIEIEALLAGTRLEGAEVLVVSSLTGQGVSDLERRLMQAAQEIGQRNASGRFRLSVDRSFILS